MNKSKNQAEIQFWESGVSRTPLEDCDLASIVLTKSTIFIGWGKAEKGARGQAPSSRVTLVATLELKGNEFFHDTDLNADILVATPQNLADATKRIFEAAPLVSNIAVSAFGPFEKIGRHFRNEIGYGVFKELTTHREWSRKDLYGIVKVAAIQASKEHARVRQVEAECDPSFNLEPEVIIGLDVNLAALGEHWWHIEQMHKGDARWRAVREGRLSPQHLNEHYLRLARQTTTYVKVSHSVNVGFTDQGWIGRGRHHSQMSAYQPRRTLTNGYYDGFKGSCDVHGDCIEGLVSTKAIAARLIENGSPGVNDAGRFILPGEQHIVWGISAEYIAEMIHTIVMFIAPYRISLGGILFSDPDGQGGRDHFITELKKRYQNKLYGKNKKRPVPFYNEMRDIHSFIRYRSCKYPGVFGGLILARWDQTNEYPVSAQVE